MEYLFRLQDDIPEIIEGMNYMIKELASKTICEFKNFRLVSF